MSAGSLLTTVRPAEPVGLERRECRKKALAVQRGRRFSHKSSALPSVFHSFFFSTPRFYTFRRNWAYLRNSRKGSFRKFTSQSTYQKSWEKMRKRPVWILQSSALPLGYRAKPQESLTLQEKKPRASAEIKFALPDSPSSKSSDVALARPCPPCHYLT